MVRASALALSDAVAFSFYATKNLSTGEGGMVTCRDASLYARMRVLSLHGMCPAADSWSYDVVECGFKYNMSDLTAAVGLVQLARLDEMNRRRADIAHAYNAAFAEMPALEPPPDSASVTHAWQLYILRVNSDRAHFIAEMRQRGVGCSVHFKPIPLHSYYRDRLELRDPCTRAMAEYPRLVSLPLSSRLTDDEVAPRDRRGQGPMRLKRTFDIVVSAVAMLVLSPILALVAIVVLVDSGRPALFSQKRIGRRFEPFRLWKFRTMTQGSVGLPITVPGDARITRAGRFLRASKLDELPQLWNVLRGEMSLVGPRPEQPVYVEMFHDRYVAVLTLRPGLTDSASICFRYEERVMAAAADPEAEYTKHILPDKLALAQEYVRTRSFGGDLGILVRTLWAIAAPPLGRQKDAIMESVRDIDAITTQLREYIPGVEIEQLRVLHPSADDDGLWFVRVLGRVEEIQIESPNGMCPFLIESDFGDERFCGKCIDEVVSVVRHLYAGVNDYSD